MNLTRIAIENFKGIRDRVEIPLRPITLLFGANSVGKSTVLQALLYFRELLEHRNADADRLEVSGESIDLGGFRHFVHKHDLSLPVRIEVAIAPDDDGLPVYRVPDFDEEVFPLATLGPIREVAVKIEVQWDDSTNRAWITQYAVSINGHPLGHIQANPGYLAELTAVDLEHPCLRSPEAGTGDEEGEVLAALRTLFTEVVLPDASLGKGVAVPLGQSVIPSWEAGLPFDFEFIPASSQAWDQVPFARAVLSSFFVGAGELIWRELKRLRYIGPLRSVPERGFLARRSPSPDRWADGTAAWDLLHSAAAGIAPPELLDQVNETITSSDRLNLGYRLDGRLVMEVPAKGFAMNALVALSQQPDDADVADRIKIIIEDLKSKPQRTQLSLVDMSRATPVAPADIGAGVAQAIPIVVGVLDPQSSILVVEQPELHTHPAVQCALGDVFARQVGVNAERLFLLETHSEHLLLRLMKRIRQARAGESPEPALELKPADVSVLFVETFDGRTVFREMPLNERGELVKAWPGGFFEEDLAELM